MMNSLSKIGCLSVLFLTSTLRGAEAEDTPVATPERKCIAILNASSLGAKDVEDCRAHAQRQLNVTVRAFNAPVTATSTALVDIARTLIPKKAVNDVFLIALVEATNAPATHQAFLPSNGVAVVNVAALRTNDATVTCQRVKRMIMRNAAFLAGLPPTPDVHCVTRRYKSLADLDTMGGNFSPPWQMKFRDEAAKRGLEPVRTREDMLKRRKATLEKTKGMTPPPPPAPPAAKPAAL
jgi:predicted Zn-dependent protease